MASHLIMGDMCEWSEGGWIFANLLDRFNGLDNHIGRGLIRYCGILGKKFHCVHNPFESRFVYIDPVAAIMLQGRPQVPEFRTMGVP